MKPFEIDKRLIYRAWEKVRANKGAPGVDAVSIDLFGQRWRGNLDKLWLCRVEDYAERAVLGADPSSAALQAGVRDSA